MRLLLLLFLPLFCSPPSHHRFEVKEAFPFTFNQPVDIQEAPDGSGRLFVVEQKGKIWYFFKSRPKRVYLFLDITHKVRKRHPEEGLLGLAFHPKFRKNGFFFVNYTASHPRRTVIERYQAKGKNLSKVSPQGKVILEIPQPFGNHNGGCIAFGKDGYLYIATGDGGGAGDPLNSGQRLDTLLGKILRLDVDRQSGQKAYAIPQDNPFVGKKGVRPEIWIYGLRNPWRFSFDPKTQWLWIGDVGQNRREEIHLVPKGKNCGWNLYEGSLPYRPRKSPSPLWPPIWEYSHKLGLSVIGGFVYQGRRLPSLKGAYIFADFYSGRIWALWPKYTLPPRPKKVLLLTKTKLHISSFGLDQEGELYLLDYKSGKIFLLDKKHGF